MNTQGIKPQQIIFVIKRTKWERDLLRYGSILTAQKIHKKQKKPFTNVKTSHDRQIQNIDFLKQKLPKATFIFREELPFIDPNTFDLMVSVGGDNHFVYVSHFCGHKPIMGLNSDVVTSTGALLGFTPETAIDAILKMSKDENWEKNCNIESWSRIEGIATYPDGKKVTIPPCISEISVRSKFHDYISRYLIRKNNLDLEEHKCSGFLLTTGAGSTGWYRNCHPLGEQKESIFPKGVDFFRGIAREVSNELRNTRKFIQIQVEKRETLEIISAMDGELTIDADPNKTFDFPPGCTIVFKLSEKKLRVISS